MGKDDDIEHIINKLPVEDYIVESTKVPYGYKPIHTEISIKDKQGVQIFDIKVEREEFDLTVETMVEEIKRNDKVEYKKQEDSKQEQEKQTNQENSKSSNEDTNQQEEQTKNLKPIK